ncbi:hypothetical protein CO641_01100 [Lysobacteraceae bacterium NML91-0213]|nr:hypothetical protein CO641_01100 [Xanthomonadaceae bacterium NML91-0213]
MPLPFRLIRALLAATLLCASVACASARPTATAAEMLPLDPVSSPAWVDDMARFAAEDAARPPPPRPVVFTGSSSVRMWPDLERAFGDLPVLNRGFGGSQFRDAVHYADEIAIRYRPRRVLIYSGDNDLMSGRSPAQVAADARRFAERIQRELPGTPVAFISIKPSPFNADRIGQQREANALIADWARRQPDVDYIDVFTPMLDAEGDPRDDLFLADRLHLNAQGYALWRQIIGAYLGR